MISNLGENAAQLSRLLQLCVSMFAGTVCFCLALFSLTLIATSADTACHVPRSKVAHHISHVRLALHATLIQEVSVIAGCLFFVTCTNITKQYNA